MGKGLLIMLAGVAMMGAVAMGSASLMSREIDQQNSTYEGDVVAREIARSALNLAVAEAQRDFAAAPTKVQYTNQAYQGGSYDAAATSLSSSSIKIDVTGRYGGKAHTMSARLVKQGPLDAAIMIDAPAIQMVFNGAGYTVDGKDTPRPSGQIAFDKHGIKTNYATVRDEIRTGVGAANISLVSGVAGDGDIVSGVSKLNLQDLYTEARSKVAAGNIVNNAAITTAKTYGSVGSPAFVLFTGSSTISAAVNGVGVLLVDGDLTVTGTGKLNWEGIVVARRDTDLKFNLQGTGTIKGSLVLLQGTTSFNMPVDGKLKVKYLYSSAGLISSVNIHPYGEDPVELFEKGSNRSGSQMSKPNWETVYKAGQQMNFFISVYKVVKSVPTFLYDHYGRGHEGPSGKPYAKVQQLDQYRWKLSFEDLDEDPVRQKAAGYGSPDWDYNDQEIEVWVDCTDPASKCDADEEDGEDFDPWWTYGGGGGGGHTGGGGGAPFTGSKLQFTLGGSAKVYYSSQAINRLAPYLSVVRDYGKVVVADRWEQ